MTIQPNIGEHGTLFVTGRDQGANAVPSIILASEHYNLVARMLQQKIPVKLAVEIQATYNEEDRNTLNVIAEIPGTDNAIKDEIVMVGAHLDSWHTGTGATDNADGSATVIEAMRILKALNIRPRRTIRAALWAGEEQGLLGSRAYVAQHLAGDKNKAARDKFSVYFNLDNGYPPISGFYMERQRSGARDHDRVVEADGEPRRDHAGARAHRRDRSLVVPRRRRPRLPGGAGVHQLRRPHAPHQRRHRRAHRSECSEAGRDGDGGGPLSGLHARRHVPEAPTAQANNQPRNHVREKATTKSRKISKVTNGKASLPSWFLRVFVVAFSVSARSCLRRTGRRSSDPSRNGIYTGPEIVPSFPRTGPPSLWKRDVGAGFAGPAVAGDRLILFHRVKNRETVEAMDANTGKSIWTFDYPTSYRDDFGFDEGPRAVPVIAGGRIFTHGADGMLHGLDFASGKMLWSVDTRKVFEAPKGYFGVASSPVVDGTRVLVNVGGTRAASSPSK